MQSFNVVASLVSELAGGKNDPPLLLNVTKNTLVLQGLITNHNLCCKMIHCHTWIKVKLKDEEITLIL